MLRPINNHRAWRVSFVAAALMLAACGSAPPSNITLAPEPSVETVAASEKIGDVTIDRIQWKASKPGCKGDCPRIEIDSIAFPDIPKLSQWIDHLLSDMTGVDGNFQPPYSTLKQYVEFFWQTAQERDETHFKARVRSINGDVIAIQLNTTQHLTGAAHGIPATQFINWHRGRNAILTLDEVLIPGRAQAFQETLQGVHQQWLSKNEDAIRDPAAYTRLWPFQENRNFALTSQGVLLKYDAYSIAPYSYGQPELLIPYSALVGIFKPEFVLAKP